MASSVGLSRDDDLGDGLVLRTAGAPVETEGAQHRADDEGFEPLGTGHARDGGRHATAVEDGAGERRAGAAQVDRAGLADADEQDQRQVGVVGAAAGDRDAGDLARLAGGLADLAGAEQVEPEAVTELVGPGTEQDARVGLLERQDRERHHVDAPEGVRQRTAQGELGGRDLGWECGVV